MTGYKDGVHWGRRKETGIWLGSTSRRRFLWRGHDSLFIAAGRLGVRLMKPWRMGS